jgi:hypothetical protein
MKHSNACIVDKLFVEKSIPEDAFRLAPKLKPLDRYEVAAMGIDPLSALLIPFRVNRPNTHTFTIFEKESNEIVAMWGAVPLNKRNPNVASIWFLSSYLLDKHQRFFLQRNIKWLSYLESHYTFVYNFIVEEHKKSIRWLKWQNFSFAQKPTLVNGVKMYYFYKQLPKTKVTVQPILREVGPIWTTELTSDGQL